MLRHQPPHTDPLNFLAGQSEMARLIREFDWAHHPFGPPDSWPQSLRSALSICLHSAFPTAIYWGSDLRMLYNDAWAPVPGPRHPASLGAPARDVWADIWHVIEPQFIDVIATGEGLFVQDQLLPMRRYGALEETYWSYSFTPIRGENGAIVGVFNSGSESTHNVLAQRRMRFLLELGEELRATTDPRAACRAAVAMLGSHLRVDRAGFCETAPGGPGLEVIAEWLSPGVSSVGPTADLSRIGRLLDQTLRVGRVLRLDDVGSDPRTALPGVRKRFAQLGVGAALALPQMEAGRVAAAIFLHRREAHVWSDAEITTTDEVLHRTWRWMEREHVMQRERIMVREIDHRARNVLAVVQSVVRQTRADDLSDFRDKVDARIAALARAHSLLAAQHWNAIDLATLIRRELAAYTEASRVRIAGPAVRLPPDLAQSVALVLHELATNAAKHGALAFDGGVLTIEWRSGDEGRLLFDWKEAAPAGAPAVKEPHREGFGSLLCRTVVENQLRGSLDRVWLSTGLECRLVIPREAAGASIATTVEAPPATKSVRRRILIAEDEAIVALDLAASVESLGYELFAVCHTLPEALGAVEAATPELALLDANLGGRPSVQLAELLHDRGVPVIFATGYSQLPELPERLARVPRLSKPVTDAELARAIAVALGDSPQPQGP